MKKFLALALSLLLVLPMACFVASADTAIVGDKSWYNSTDTVFVLDSAADFVGFANVCRWDGEYFEGKTVKLGADITLNTGDASTWSSAVKPTNAFPQIYGFKGIFDGQGHTISGVYYYGASAGIFRTPDQTAVIKNFTLTNSYIGGSGNMNGGISGEGGCIAQNLHLTDSVYVNGAGNHTGSIFGFTRFTDASIENCWSEANVYGSATYVGGLVGNAHQDLTIKNSAFTGSAYCNVAVDAFCGGLLGRGDEFITFENCFVDADVSWGGEKNGATTDRWVGAMLGSLQSNNKDAFSGQYISRLKIINCWATTETYVGNRVYGWNYCDNPDNVEDGHLISRALLKGYGAYRNTTMDFENVWVINLKGEGMPILKTFFEGTPPALYLVNNPVITGEELKLDGNYGPKWTVSLEVPQGMNKSQIELGILIAPTKILPTDHDMTLEDTKFAYRGKDYDVVKVKAEIFRNSDADTMLATFVLTDLIAQNARINYTVVPYAIYTVPEGQLYAYGVKEDITFYTEAALAAADSNTSSAVKAKLEAILAPIDAVYGGRFPVAEKWGTQGALEEVPAFLLGDTDILYDRETGDGTYTMCIDGTIDSDYFEYLKLLEKYGFTKYSDNGANGIGVSSASDEGTVYASVYKKGDLVVYVTDACYLNQVFVSAGYDQPLSEHLLDNFSDDVVDGAKTILYSPEIRYWGNSIVIQLKNGHFIVNDGATDCELGFLLDHLEEWTPGDAKPVVEAWFLSHYHYDHVGFMKQFETNPAWADRVIVEGVYSNVPGEDVIAFESVVASDIGTVERATKLLKNSKNQTTPLYRVSMGQVYYFSDISVEVIFSPEIMLPSQYGIGPEGKPEYNDTSVWLHYNIDGNVINIGGDADKGSMQMVMEMYDKEFLDFDIFFPFHHDGNTWDNFTNHCTYHTIIHQGEGSIHQPTLTHYASSWRLCEKAEAAGGTCYTRGLGDITVTFNANGTYSVSQATDRWAEHKWSLT